MILVAGNIIRTGLFAGVPWRGGVKRRWDNPKHGFSGLSTPHVRQLRKWDQRYYTVFFRPLSPFHLN